MWLELDLWDRFCSVSDPQTRKQMKASGAREGCVEGRPLSWPPTRLREVVNVLWAQETEFTHTLLLGRGFILQGGDIQWTL